MGECSVRKLITQNLLGKWGRFLSEQGMIRLDPVTQMPFEYKQERRKYGGNRHEAHPGKLPVRLPVKGQAPAPLLANTTGVHGALATGRHARAAAGPGASELGTAQGLGEECQGGSEEGVGVGF